MIYLFIFALLFMLAKFNHNVSLKNDFTFKFIFFFLFLFIAFRNEVGADWENYLWHIYYHTGTTYDLSFSTRELFYYSILWFSSNIFGGINFLNSILAIFFCYGLYQFCISQKNRYSVLLAAFPYLVVVISLGFSRQSASIGLFLLAIIYLINGENLKYLLIIILASTIHLSVIIFIPLVLFFIKLRNFLFYPFVLVLLSFSFSNLIAPNIDYYENSYIIRQYQSSGALIRLTMNALPALVFLIFKSQIAINKNSLKMWSIFSYLSIFCFFLFFIFPSSTALDRISFYLIPLQLFVLSNLSNIPFTINRSKIGLNFIFLYGALVLLVWTQFAVHSEYWFPYDSSIFNILSSVWN